jgi:hypothetical protein
MKPDPFGIVIFLHFRSRRSQTPKPAVSSLASVLRYARKVKPANQRLTYFIKLNSDLSQCTRRFRSKKGIIITVKTEFPPTVERTWSDTLVVAGFEDHDDVHRSQLIRRKLLGVCWCRRADPQMLEGFDAAGTPQFRPAKRQTSLRRQQDSHLPIGSDT